MTATIAEKTELPSRDIVATRLLKTAEKHSYNPDVDIDWDQPPVPGLYWGVPEHSSLYGTHLWAGLTEEQRIELTKHEVVSIASVGIWFEMILMQMLLRHLYDENYSDSHARHTLTEIAEECRHSMMFGRLAATAGAPAYGVGSTTRQLGRLFKTTATPTLVFGGTLYVEEILDGFQRDGMNDERVQPLARAVNRLHVVEEARHMKFAREEMARQLSTAGRLTKAHDRLVLGGVAYFATQALIHPRAYAAVGLDPAEARKVAQANPFWRQTKRNATEKVLDFYNEHGMLTGPGRGFWKAAHLI